MWKCCRPACRLPSAFTERLAPRDASVVSVWFTNFFAVWGLFIFAYVVVMAVLDIIAWPDRGDRWFC